MIIYGEKTEGRDGLYGGREKKGGVSVQSFSEANNNCK